MKRKQSQRLLVPLLFTSALFGPGALAQDYGTVDHRFFRADSETSPAAYEDLELLHFDPYSWMMDAVVLEGDELSLMLDVSKFDVSLSLAGGALDVAVLRGAGTDPGPDYDPLDLVAVLEPGGVRVLGWSGTESPLVSEVLATQDNWQGVTRMWSADLGGTPTLFGFEPGGTGNVVKRMQLTTGGPAHLSDIQTDVDVLDLTTLHYYPSASQRLVTAMVGSGSLRVYGSAGQTLMSVDLPGNGTSQDRIVELGFEAEHAEPNPEWNWAYPCGLWSTQDVNTGHYVLIGFANNTIVTGQDTGLSLLEDLAVGDLDGDGWHDLKLVAADGGPWKHYTGLRHFSGTFLLSFDTGEYFSSTNMFPGAPAGQIALGDVDNDGDLDALSAHEGQDYFRLRRTTGSDSGANPVTRFISSVVPPSNPPLPYLLRSPIFEIDPPAVETALPSGIELRVEVFDIDPAGTMVATRRFFDDMPMPATSTTLTYALDVAGMGFTEGLGLVVSFQAVLKNAAGNVVRSYTPDSYYWVPDLNDHVEFLLLRDLTTGRSTGGGTNSTGSAGGGQGSGCAGNDPPDPRT